MKIIPLDFRHRAALAIDKQLKKSDAKNNPLQQLFWECTLRCNLKCRHCGSDCHKEAEIKDMPREDFMRVLDQVADAYDPHKVLVVITGGEPLMRRDLEECGREINRREFPWGMVTNGLAMTQYKLNRLIDAGLHSITVSIDGLEDNHDWMRGVEGSYKKALGAIEMITKTNLTHDAVTCVNRENISQLPQLKERLISIGLKRWRLFTVFPVGRAATDKRLLLTNEEFRSLMKFIKTTRKEGRIMANYGCEGFLGNYEGDVRDHFYSCHAGVTIGSVLADGSISACPSIRANYSQGNIYTDNFIDVWKNRYKPYRDREWMRNGECGDCEYFKYCKGNGMHLRNEKGELLLCHLKKLTEK